MTSFLLKNKKLTNKKPRNRYFGKMAINEVNEVPSTPRVNPEGHHLPELSPNLVW